MADADEIIEKPDSEDLMPSETVLNGLKAYGPFIILGWCAFEVARRKYEQAYYCRERSPETASSSTATARRSGFLGWIVPLYMTSDDVVLQTCGMDTLFFFRFMRLCQKIALMGILLSAAMFPVYYLGQDDDADILFKLTLSHLNSNDESQLWRFWFTVGSNYVLSAWTCYLLWQEFVEYVRRRHEFLARKDTMQYSIVINGLPNHLQTQQTLRNYMNVLFPDSVVHVYVALECGALERLVAERVKVRNRLEHALAQSAELGERVMTSSKMVGGEQVDAIELYKEQLKSLNDAVEMEVRSILRNQAALANEMLGGDMLNTTTSDVPTLQIPHDEFVIIDGGEAAESEYIRNLRSKNGSVKETGIMRGAGFVTFNTLRAAQAAQQVLQASDPAEMRVEAAPHVDDVVWENLGISLNVKSSWELISLGATVGIIIFWTIPTAFVVTISKVSSLKEKWPALKSFAEDNTWIEPVLQQISPLMLSVMNALAPIIFGILSKREGHAAAAEVNKSLFNKLVAYQWFMVFLLPVLGGTFLDSLLGKGDESLEISALVNKISEAIPVQSSFFISFLMVQMGLPTSLELLRVIPIAKSLVYKFFAPKLTPRERSSPWFGLAPLNVPGDLGATDPIAQFLLVLILILVFSTVAPILCYFAAAYLFLSELVQRWFALCVADPSPHTGAVFFPALYRFCVFALLFSQVIMATVLGLKEAALPATFALILPIFTVIFHFFISSRYPRIALNLPLDECVLIDVRRHQQRDDLESVLEDVYLQPAMSERDPLVPDYANLESNPDTGKQLSSPPSEYT